MEATFQKAPFFLFTQIFSDEILLLSLRSSRVKASRAIALSLLNIIFDFFTLSLQISWMTFQGSSRQFIFNRLHVVALHSHFCSVSADLRNIPSFRTLRSTALKLKWKPWIASFHGKRGSEKLCFVNCQICVLCVLLEKGNFK